MGSLTCLRLASEPLILSNPSVSSSLVLGLQVFNHQILLFDMCREGLHADPHAYEMSTLLADSSLQPAVAILSTLSGLPRLKGFHG